MRAVVKYDQGDDRVELRDVPVPVIGDGDVLVRVKAAGVCGSDVEMWRHRFTYRVNTPVIQGHEFCGVVESVGRAVSGWKAGDRVVSETSAFVCGRCRFCRSGDYNLCPERLGYGYGVDGAFTSFVRVRQEILHCIPERLSFEEAAITEPYCVGWNALVARSRIRPGDCVVVIGPGPIGLACLTIAAIAGAGRLLVVGTPQDERRLAAARAIAPGAEILLGKPDEAIPRVREATEGYGADLVVDAAGSSATLAMSMAMVRRMGQITKVGWGPEPVGISLDPLLSKAVTLQGTYGHSRPAWQAVIHLLGAGRISPRHLITDVLPLERWREGYESVESRRAVKVILTP